MLKLIECAVGRVMDKSSIVRKAAMTLVTTIVERNPYSHMLTLHDFEKKRDLFKNEIKVLFLPVTPLTDCADTD